MWHDIFVGNSRKSAKIKSHANKLPPQKIPRKCTLLFTLLNFNELGCKQCNENDHMAFVFVTFKYRTWNPRKIWNPNSQKICFSKLEKLKLPRRVDATRYFYWRTILSERGLTKITVYPNKSTQQQWITSFWGVSLIIIQSYFDLKYLATWSRSKGIL